MKSMLVIDGSEIFSRLFAEIFEKLGWSVGVCADREGAVERLAGGEHYDAILLGYRVHGTTGLQLVRLIRSLEHRKLAAVVMVTDKSEVTEEALAAGADEVLLKPINPHALVWVVDRHVS
ncbi:MAG: response regulator [Blastocatellia bacterium]